ncbi:MAG: YceI family protein [Candidatus Vogelbacteria bacterium]|nr:YceI family protein [Candidatus Vogelbacteria bacterium]
MNKDLIIGTIVLIIIVIGGLWWASKTPVVVPTDGVSTGENTVTTLPEDQGEAYLINTASSTFKWIGSFVGGISEAGTVKVSQGQFNVVENTLTGGQFTIDLDTIKDNAGKTQLEDHLKNADFFDVAKYPTATLMITKLEAGDPATAEAVVTGDLTIKGITKPITFPAIITLAGNTITAKAKFSFDRSLWEIKYGSETFFKNLGDKVIKNEVSVEVTIVAVKQ